MVEQRDRAACWTRSCLRHYGTFIAWRALLDAQRARATGLWKQPLNSGWSLLAETSKGLVQQGSGSSATEGCEASSASSCGDLGSAPQQPSADAADTAGRQPSACRSDSSGSGMSCDTAVEGLSRASSGLMADAEAAAEQACSPEQLQGRQTGQEQANSTSQQPHMEGDTATQGPAAASADDSPAGDPLTLRQRFSFGLFRPPPPPPPPPQDAAPQDV